MHEPTCQGQISILYLLVVAWCLAGFTSFFFEFTMCLMASFSNIQSQNIIQRQSQKQVQKLSQVQIQALNLLAMSPLELKEEIAKALSENPALEISRKSKSQDDEKFGDYSDYGKIESYGNFSDADKFQQVMEAQADDSETLQSHLMHQLNSMNLSPFEYEISQKLIYNLDANGFYGSMIAPESFLPSRTEKNFQILRKCIDRIQKMDPVGICCKTPEESLFVQAKQDEKAPKLALFILDGHLELINPPEKEKVFRKLKDFQTHYHKKMFGASLPLDSIDYNLDSVQQTIDYILHLNVRPAQGYVKDTVANFEQPDVVLIVEKKRGGIGADSFENGIVSGDENFHFQVKYGSGDLPELQICKDFSFDSENVQKALVFIQNLKFRESTIVLQGCAIVKAQSDFFLHGEGHLVPLTHRQIAEQLQIHESTVSRMASKKSNRFIQTEWGLLPVSYFFLSGVSSVDGKQKISSQQVIQIIKKILIEQKNSGQSVSDLQLTKLLAEKGIKIARRTVSKYRALAGIENSYKR